MKMGLSMVLIGHVNFLIGALVHGAVLRHINFHKQAKAVEYAISNVVALTSGLVVRRITLLSSITEETSVRHSCAEWERKIHLSYSFKNHLF